jgi:nucleotide-binding universal stress UspA family protein
MKRVLVAVDGSDGADRAIAFAATQVRDSGDELIIVNVIGGYGLPGEVFRQLTEGRTSWFEDLLNANSATILAKGRERALAAGATAIQLESRSGDVVQSVLDFADEKDVEAIVVGKRGNSPLNALLVGSVAQKLVSLAKRVVIVVP